MQEFVTVFFVVGLIFCKLSLIKQWGCIEDFCCLLYNAFVILNVRTVQNNAVLILNYLYKQKFLEFF